MRKEQLIRFIDQVIAHGESIQVRTAQGKTDESPGTTWYPRVMSVFHVLGSRADPWKFAVAKCPTNLSSGTADKVLGALKAIREAVDRGLVTEIEDTAHAEAFARLLEQAQQLSNEGHHAAAGSVAQAVLQEHLREWCLRAASLPQSAGLVDELTTALYRRGHVTRAEMDGVMALNGLGLHCQQSNQPPISADAIQRMVQDTSAFIEAHPLPSS